MFSFFFFKVHKNLDLTLPPLETYLSLFSLSLSLRLYHPRPPLPLRKRLRINAPNANQTGGPSSLTWARLRIQNTAVLLKPCS